MSWVMIAMGAVNLVLFQILRLFTIASGKQTPVVSRHQFMDTILFDTGQTLWLIISQLGSFNQLSSLHGTCMAGRKRKVSKEFLK